MTLIPCKSAMSVIRKIKITQEPTLFCQTQRLYANVSLVRFCKILSFLRASFLPLSQLRIMEAALAIKNESSDSILGASS